MIGRSSIMQQLFSAISKVAPTDATILIHGETGTGKELVAQALHQHSPRKHHAMISVNCAAIPDTLIESELFGYERGAFTGAHTMRQGLIEAANGGTLFLDEIGELPLDAQARLLRVLQQKEVRRIGATQPIKVNVRIIAATHRNLKQRIEEGLFREDLYYRIQVIELNVPPLKARGNDILLLANQLIHNRCKTLNRPLMTLSAAAQAVLTRYTWPGNIRELENIIERSVILTDSNVIEPTFFNIELTPFQSDSLDDYFCRFIQQHQDHYSETELAQKLGISRKTLWERRQRFGVPKPLSNTTS